MLFRKAFLVVTCITALAAAMPAQAQQQDEETALPIPRFVSLKSSEVNLRTGPGVRYPVRWVYHKKALPMEVIEEFEQWRRIRDVSGESGWVHKTLLSGRRMVIVTADTVTLYRKPETSSPPIIRAQKGVVGDLLSCEAKWCRLQINNMKGWLPKSEFWGVYPKEEFD